MMKLSAEGRLKLAVKLAWVAGAGVATNAYSEENSSDSSSTTLEKVEVTGSRIRRVDVETASPLYTIDRATIEASGVTTVGQLVQELPSMSGAATNPRVNNGGGTGAAVVSLRGLGEQRTLVLLNGRRVVTSVNGIVEGVDIDSFPINLIERVEVLKEGAGAVYGSDAIGGVVNFITRKDFNGGEISGQYGQSGRQDGRQKSASLSWGTNSRNANIMLGLNYNLQDGISAGRREFSKNALYLYGGVVTAGGSSRIPNGRLNLPTGNPIREALGCSSVTRIEGRSGASTDDYRCFDASTDLYNYQPFNLLLTPQERGSLFTVANYRVADFAEAYAEVFFNDTHSGFDLAPLPLDAANDAIVISADSIYNPFGIDFGPPPNSNARYRLEALGNRRSSVEGMGGQANLGLRGDLLHTGWKWDASFSFGRAKQITDIDGYLFKPAFQPAIGPSFRDANGNPTCGTPDAPIAGCTPLNIFNLPLALQDPAQAAQFAAATAGYTNQTTRVLRLYNVNFNGPIWPLPAGELQGAAGFERREQHLIGRTDFLTLGTPPDFLTCQLAQETCSNNTSGTLNVNELYAELLVPVLAHMPGAEQLNINGGIRWSDYNRFGSTTNGSVALEYRPINDLLVRATWAEVFRAPTITDLFLAITANAPTFLDPCVGFTGGATAEFPNLPAACQNVTADTPDLSANSQITGRYRGNPDAQPEKGHVLTYGIVYDPDYLKGFSTTIDFWRYKLRGTLEPVDVNTVATACAVSGDPQFCGLIHRFDDGTINFVDQPILNLGNIDAQGVDIGFKYALGKTPVGRFHFGVDVSYIDQWDRSPAPGLPIAFHEAGTFNKQDGNFARVRGIAFADWKWTEGEWLDFDALLKLRYVGHLTVIDADGHPDTDGDGVADVPTDLPIGSVTYTDLSVGWTAPVTKTHIELGAQNLFDRQPPLFYQNNVINANTDVETYDTIGNFFFVKVTQKF